MLYRSVACVSAEMNFGVGDRVKSLRKFNWHGHCNVWWPVDDAESHLVCKGEKCCGGRVSLTKVLFYEREGQYDDLSEKMSLEDFG